jgi:hypothetical protein
MPISAPMSGSTDPHWKTFPQASIPDSFFVPYYNAIPVTLSDKRKQPRQIFVAYAYALYARADYRKVFKNLHHAFEVDFVFADERITNLHILTKIENYIRESQFGIYDISGWNANVTLELGLAFGLGERAFIAFDPAKTNLDEVPADLRGIDRIQYSSYSELEEGVGELIGQELPIPTLHEAENPLAALRRRALELLAAKPGLKIRDIAVALGITGDLAQVVVRPLVGAGIRTEGQTRGMKYYLDETGRPQTSQSG